MQSVLMLVVVTTYA